MQNGLYLCFIDYTKAFDCVKHQKLIKVIESLNVDGKDVRVITNLYWQQIPAVRGENELSEYKQIQRGVRQGCVLSPDLFIFSLVGNVGKGLRAYNKSPAMES